MWVLVGFRAAFIYFDSGTSRLKLQVSQPRCRAMIDYNALTFSGLSSKSIPDIYHPFSKIGHVWLGRHLGPLYLPRSPSPPAPNLPYLTSKNNVAQVVYAPIQIACLSWT